MVRAGIPEIRPFGSNYGPWQPPCPSASPWPDRGSCPLAPKPAICSRPERAGAAAIFSLPVLLGEVGTVHHPDSLRMSQPGRQIFLEPGYDRVMVPGRFGEEALDGPAETPIDSV